MPSRFFDRPAPLGRQFFRLSAKAPQHKTLRAEKKKSLRASPRLLLFSAGILDERCEAGSMTLEASLVLPLFLFFLMSILLVLDVLRLQCSMLEALHETGTELCEYAYYYRQGTDGCEALGEDLPAQGISFVLTETYVRQKVADFLGEDYLDSTCLEGGASGISYLRSSLLSGNDEIVLTADYRAVPFIRLFGQTSVSLQSRFAAHAWVGFDPSEASGSDAEQADEEEDTWVYVTAYGTVYHRDPACSYLNPSVHAVDSAEVSRKRSRDGSIYYPCESCRPGLSGTVYITDDGNRYHSSVSCSGLKRSVRQVRESEAEQTLHACPKCGQKEQE